MFSHLFESFAISLTVSLAAIGALIWIANKYNIYPKSSFRRPGQVPVPLLGGVAIYLGMFAGALAIQDKTLWSVMIAAAPLVIMGVLDDVIEIKARTKIVGQILSTVLWIGLVTPSGLLFTRLGLPPIFGAGIAFIFILALMNAYNFLDGIDGQIGGMAAIVLVFIALAEPRLEVVSFVILAATAAFLCFNMPPAKIYLGETGSSLLGFSIAALCTLFPIERAVHFQHFLALCFYCSLPFCDLLVAIVRRISLGLPPWYPDREHFHHKMIKLGLSVPKALMVSYMIMFFSSITGYVLLRGGTGTGPYITAFISFGLLTHIYASILLVNGMVARRVSYFGRTLIEKHFPLMRNIKPLDVSRSGVLFDFLPYYEEVQSKGIREVERFVREMSRWAQVSVPASEFRLIGSYSVLMVLNAGIKIDHVIEDEISRKLFDALLQLGIVKNLKMPPEGLIYYAELSDPELRDIIKGNFESPSTFRAAG